MPRDPRAHALDDRIRCQHMLEAAEQAMSFTSGRSRADLDGDPMLTRALVHAIQEIGEAAARVSDEGRAHVPGLPWEQIVGMRHRLVHQYWDINRDLVWAVADRDLAPLINTLREAFGSWPLPAEG
ncbi:MAG: HepT-like ribonuclease domain-containing protein [Phycisphaerales bacterium]